MVSLSVTKPSHAILGGGDSVFSIGILLDLSPDADYGKRITGRPIGRKADGYRRPGSLNMFSIRPYRRREALLRTYAFSDEINLTTKDMYSQNPSLHSSANEVPPLHSHKPFCSCPILILTLQWTRSTLSPGGGPETPPQGLVLVMLRAQYNLGHLRPSSPAPALGGLHGSRSDFLLSVGALCPITGHFPPQVLPTHAPSQGDTDEGGRPDGGRRERAFLCASFQSGCLSAW